MKVQLLDGREFRVTFVHSAVKPAPAEDFVLGGSLRQIVENLAYSLRRRVTLCEIAVVSPPVVDYFARFESPVPVNTPIGHGLSVCHWRDNFNKKIGREESLKRALASARLDAATKREIVDVLGFGSDTE